MLFKIRHIAISIVLTIVSSSLNAVCTANFIYIEQSPLVVQFQNTSESYNEGNVHYYWDFDDGYTSYEENPNHTYSAPGIYNVSLTLITTNLCYASKTISLLVGIPQTSPYCSLEIDFETQNATAPNFDNGIITVFGYSDVPCCYYALWSNGEEGETIGNLSPGTYCVTLTNGEDCFGTSCVTIGYNNNCVASFFIDSLTFSHLDGAYRFVNNSHGEQRDFFWDFGDGTTSNAFNPLHVYTDTGTYQTCLSINTYYNCTNTICKTLNVDYISPMTANLVGIVRAGETLLPHGIAILYKFVDENYKAIDYTVFEDGIYTFDSLPKDVFYLTHIIPYFNLEEIYFPKYTPTYFNNSVYWQDCSLINLYNDTIYSTSLNSYNEIYLNNGVIEGAITYEDTLGYEEEIFQRDWFSDDNFNEGFAANIVVLLKNEAHEILDFRLTKSDGSYRFDNLEYGGYYLSAEKPGLFSDEIFVELSEVVAVLPGNNFCLTQSGFNGISDFERYSEENIFPNPAHNEFFINCEKPGCVIRITDTQARLINSTALFVGLNKIDISNYKSGIYYITIVNNLETSVKKLVVN